MKKCLLACLLYNNYLKNTLWLLIIIQLNEISAQTSFNSPIIRYPDGNAFSIHAIVSSKRSTHWKIILALDIFFNPGLSLLDIIRKCISSLSHQSLNSGKLRMHQIVFYCPLFVKHFITNTFGNLRFMKIQEKRFHYITMQVPIWIVVPNWIPPCIPISVFLCFILCCRVLHFAIPISIVFHRFSLQVIVVLYFFQWPCVICVI